MRQLIPLLLCCGLAACGSESEAEPTCEDGAANTKGWCPENAICMDVKSIDGETVTRGNLAVMWYRPDAADPTPKPQIAYETVFDSGTRSIIIYGKDIKLPVGDDLLLCQRTCADATTGCFCGDGPTVATAVVAVAKDLNGDGHLDAREVEASYYGLGDFEIAWGDREYEPAPAPFDAIFADNIREGTHVYKSVAYANTGTVRLATPDKGTVFDLAVCADPDSRTGCVPAFPAIRVPSGI